jgi:glycosyltransferase involved in cell wall biosynthesis
VNVLYLYDGRWPHNATRPSKQIHVLLERGHRVRILSRGAPGTLTFEEDGAFSVARIPYTRPPRLNRLLSYPVFVNPYWLYFIRRHTADIRADCIIARDLPLAPAALLVGRLHGIPVHYDMAEVYPLALHSMLPHETGAVLRAVRATGAANAVEQLVVRSVATTFVVSEESRERCVALGVPPERVVVVGNTPENPEALLADWDAPQDIEDLAGRPIILFVGNVFADRGLAHAIDAMPLVRARRPDAVLVVIGDGRERPRLEEQARALGLGDAVRFLGWKHHDDHPRYLRHAQIGILPFLDTPHIGVTLANKLFDYMGAGLPVVASDVRPMRRVLETTDSGVLVPAGEHRALADAFLRLLGDPALRARLGANGRAAIAGPYAWREDARRFADAVERAQGRA